MYSQEENQRPIGFKRRQSRVFQGLTEREPVTKSPFRHDTDDPLLPPLPPPQSDPVHLPTPTSSASPKRSSLVSKRFHGPRVLGSELPKRERRKTVTFYDECDVLEFHRDEGELEDPFDSDSTDDYGAPEPDRNDEDEGYANDSITGLVDSMLQDARDESRPNTPSDRMLHPGVDTEDGVPYGRTHHIERVIAEHHHQATPPSENPDQPFLTQDELPAINTPPQQRTSNSDIAVTSPGSNMPVGRTTHSEITQAEYDDELEADVRMLPPSPSPAKAGKTVTGGNSVDIGPNFGIEMPHTGEEESANGDATNPFAVHVKDEVQIVELSFMSGTGSVHDDVEPSNLSIGHSEVSLSGLEDELGMIKRRDKAQEETNPTQTSTPPPTSPLNLRSSTSSLRHSLDPLEERLPMLPRSRSSSPFDSPLPARVASPAMGRAGSPASRSALLQLACPCVQRGLMDSSSSGSLSSISGRSPRISREEVQRRLRKRSQESPAPEETAARAVKEADEDRAVSGSADNTLDIDDEEKVVRPTHTLRREGNPTYDGVLSLDPEPQSNDPPRPSLPTRSLSTSEAATATGFKGLNFDLPGSNSALELGLNDIGFGTTGVNIGEVRSALDRLVDNVSHHSSSSKGSSTSADHGNGSSRHTSTLRLDAVTEGVNAGLFEPPADADADMEEGFETGDQDDEGGDKHRSSSRISLSPSSESISSPQLLHGNNFISPPLSRSGSGNSNPSQPPPKDAIRHREQQIMEKRRELRRREEEEAMAVDTPPRHVSTKKKHAVGNGRPSRRRSMSANDAEDLELERRRELANVAGNAERCLLNVVPLEAEDDPLADSIARELRKLGGLNKGKYHIREHQGTIYASSDADKISHMDTAGDVDSGKAWRTVRRPSDMNEYAKQIRQYRSQEKPGKAHGKVFVRVVGVKSLDIPIPQQSTAMSCTLNNGIHFVTTPECRLARDCRIDQEFELIEHQKLEFTLTLKVRRDPHVVAQFKANAPRPTPPPPQPPPPPASKGGMRSFFSPTKKSAKVALKPAPPLPPPTHKLEENLARYLKLDGQLARAFVCFKDIGDRCDTKLFETTYPLIGQRMETGSKVTSMQVGELVLQFFRLPPLPGVPSTQSLRVWRSATVGYDIFIGTSRRTSKGR